MKSIHLIIFPLFLLLHLTSCKEEYVEPQRFGTLKGNTLHSEDFTPIPNAAMKITPSYAAILTDASGKFVINNLPVGGYTVEVKKAGFKTELLTIQVSDGQTTEVDILMTPDLTPNTPPQTPTIISPVNFATNQPTTLTLRWRAFDVDNDNLTFNVYFFKEGQSVQTPLASNIADTLLEVSNLEFGATYHWQVAVTDGESGLVFSPVWTFSTAAYPQHRIRWTRKVEGKYQVFCTDDNGFTLQMTQGSTNRWRPHLSPDRKQVAFLSNQGIEPHLYVMDFDGTNVQKLSTIPVAGVDILEVDFCWSPNSSQLLYVNNDRLFSIQRDGTGLQLVAQAPPGMQFASVDWTEQGNMMVVRLTGTNVYQSEIRLLNQSGTWSTLVPDAPGRTGNAVFSVDGTKVLYTHDVSGFQNVDGRQLDSHIFLLNITNGQTTDLSIQKPAGTNDLDPRFSPTGSQVIFTNTPNDGISTKRLYKVNLDGQSRELMVDNAEMGDWY